MDASKSPLAMSVALRQPFSECAVAFQMPLPAHRLFARVVPLRVQQEPYSPSRRSRSRSRITPRDTSLDGYLTPYRVGSSCDKVLKGNEPRMCKDWKNLGGSWTECTKSAAYAPGSKFPRSRYPTARSDKTPPPPPQPA